MNMYTPSEVIANYAKTGSNKAEMPVWRMLLLGILAGMAIAFASVAGNTSMFSLSNVSAGRVVCGLLFPFGLGIIIMTGSELFTGNSLIIISVLDKQAKIKNMLKNWLFVYIGNLTGGLLISYGCALIGQFNYSSNALAVFTIKLAAAKCSMTFGSALISGIFCNVLVCLGVLVSSSAQDTAGRILGAYIPVALFVICGFEHCVANMYYIPAGLFAAKVPAYAATVSAAGVDCSMLTWGNFFGRNLIPVSLGNIIGGTFVGALMWVCHSVKKPGCNKFWECY